jgi:hypothetical protein
MKRLIGQSLGLGISLVAMTATLMAGPASKPPVATGSPLPTDWSHQHMIFSHPRTPEQAARVSKDIRYNLQLQRLNARRSIEVPIDEESLIASPSSLHHARRRGRRMHRDWSTDLGPLATAGAAHFPAKFSFSASIANCGLATSPDFIVFNTGVLGSGTQATIAAFTNLYNGCGGPVPANFWGYDTGGAVLTSPVLSLDGTQVAFTQTGTPNAQLVLLKWAKFIGSVQAPMAPTLVLASAYPTCTAPCMTTFALSGSDTNSSVYYDYGNDMAWVGDDSGKLHQYTNLFNVSLLGTAPAEVTTGGWPASVSGTPLTSAVHDDSTDDTFVGDKGGFLYSVSSAGAAAKSSQLDFGTGLTEGPVIDSSIGSVYVFSSSDGAGSAAVFQLSTGFAGGATGTEAKIGASSTGTTPQFNGGFDHDYILSANSTGNMWVCGNPGGEPTLYQVSVTAGVVGAVKAGPVLSTTTETPCSPVTEVYNPNLSGGGLPEEWAFASVQGAGSPTGCLTFACIMNFRVSSWQPNTVYNSGQLILDSNLNIQVADNSGNTSGATMPAWNITLFGPTVDGTVHWRNQGALSGQTPATWVANNMYTGGFEIVDTNNNIEISELGGGTSGLGPAQPTWPLAEGVETFDGTVVWYNLGANPVAALQAPGGTSGIVIDNTIDAPFGSQVYYSTLQPSSCGGGPTGGCAVQASQQGLQ